MHGPDHQGGGGGDHAFHPQGSNGYGFNAGHGPGHNTHFAGGGDHAGAQGSHNLSIANVAGDIFGGHGGSVAFEGLVFMAFLDWAGGHHGGTGFHYSFSNNLVHVGYDHANHIDGTGINGPGKRGMRNTLKPVAVSDMQADADSRIFIVHAHNIGDPDLKLLMMIWPEKFGLVDITDTPGLAGVKGDKDNACLSWDWTHPDDGPLPPGALPGVTVDTVRFKRIYQIGRVNPRLSTWRKIQINLGFGAPPRRGELVADVHSNVTIEVYGLQWVYKQTGTAEVKLEIRLKPSLRYYPGEPATSAGIFSRTHYPATSGRWAIVPKTFAANQAAALALAKRLLHELSGFKRVPGKLESYLDTLSKLPGGYRPPTNDIPDGVTRGTAEDERALEDVELEQARNQDRGSDAQLPTTVPTTPATPTTPASNVDGLPSTPDQDTGSAVDGLPGYTQFAPAAASALPSAPGTVTAALGLPAAAPMPETQMGNQLEGKPIKTVDPDGTVAVHVGLSDFQDDHLHHI